MSMKVWSDVVHDTAIGKTKGTKDAINSNASGVKIQKKTATALLGFEIGVVITAGTDAEVIPNVIIEVTNKALGITMEQIIVPCGSNDYDANTPYTATKKYFRPFKIPEGKESRFFGSEFTFTIAPTSSNTGGFDIAVAVIYADQDADSEFVLELMTQKPGRVDGGVAEADAAKAHAAASTQVTLTALTISAGVTQLRGLIGSMQPNGITAGDPILSIFEYICSGIDDFSPQVWISQVNWHPALGTVAEASIKPADAEYTPTRFPVDGNELTITVKSQVGVVAATAPDTTQGLLYRR